MTRFLARALTAAAVCGLLVWSAGSLTSPAMAEDAITITEGMASFTVQTPDGPVEVKRIQDENNEITGFYAKTSHKCPPFCIQPMDVGEGVQTIGELELIDSLKDPDTVVIDARTLEWHLRSTIPGSVHIPYTEVAGRLNELGCTKKESGWDCANAKTVALYCNGPWCGQSPTAIRAMLREGYPADRIQYYRGGMQLWQLLGFSTIEGAM